MKLEEFRKNPQVQNMEDLSEGHEMRFENRLEEAFGNRRNGIPWLKVAAVLLLVLSGTGYWYVSQEQAELKANAEVQEEEGIPMEDAKMYYNQSLNAQFELLAKSSESPESKWMIKESQELINELDSANKELEKQLKITGDQRVAAAMINNYKNRIQILEVLILKINYVNQLKHEKNENNAS